MSADSSLLDAAILNTLANDATLRALVTGGVHWDMPPEGTASFAIVSLSHFEREPGFDAGDAEDGLERVLYLVKAVMQQTGGTALRDAAARIHTLLHHNIALALNGAPYTVLDIARLDRVRYTEADPTNPAARWQHRGGLYEVTVSL